MTKSLCIPSKNRPTFLTLISFNNFCHYENVEIYVEPQDYDKYKYLCTKDNLKVINIEEDNKGVAYVKLKKIILEKLRKRESFWLIDDDIQHLSFRYAIKTSSSGSSFGSFKSVEKHEIKNILEKTEQQAEKEGFALFSFPQRQKAWYNLNKISEGRVINIVYFCVSNIKEIDKIISDIEDIDCNRLFMYEDFLYNYIFLKYQNKIGMWWEYCYGQPDMGSKDGGCKTFYKDNKFWLLTHDYIEEYFNKENFKDYSWKTKNRKSTGERTDLSIKWKKVGL